MNIETRSDPWGLWRLYLVHRLVGLHREAGVSGVDMRRSHWTKTLARTSMSPEVP